MGLRFSCKMHPAPFVGNSPRTFAAPTMNLWPNSLKLFCFCFIDDFCSRLPLNVWTLQVPQTTQQSSCSQKRRSFSLHYSPHCSAGNGVFSGKNNQHKAERTTNNGLDSLGLANNIVRFPGVKIRQGRRKSTKHWQNNLNFSFQKIFCSNKKLS